MKKQTIQITKKKYSNQQKSPLVIEAIERKKEKNNKILTHQEAFLVVLLVSISLMHLQEAIERAQ
jgi:hypothetical protein